MRSTINRRISDREIAVIRAALGGARVPGAEALVEPSLENLQVVGGCACGCASVEFARSEESVPSVVVADGIGTTDAGGMVGVLVWGEGGRLTGLEIYDLGAGQND